MDNSDIKKEAKKRMSYSATQISPPALPAGRSGKLDSTYSHAANIRIKIMKGHLDALSKMIKEDRNCTCLLDQSLAIQNSLKSLDVLILDKYLKSNLVEQFSSKKENAVQELLEVFKRKQNRIIL